MSGITSVLPVLFLLSLLLSGAPAQRPSVSLLGARVSDLGLTEVFLLGLGALFFGVLLHPLQFGMTQFLEGYWGPSGGARRAMARSAQRHLARWYQLAALSKEGLKQLTPLNLELFRVREAVDKLGSSSAERVILEQRERELLEQRVPHAIAVQEADRRISRYPSAPEVMPTRLGNVLRRFEREAGYPFGLDAVVALPYIAVIADEAERTYLDDMRSSMDLAVRFVVVWALCACAGTLLLWRHDVWLLVPMACYMFAVLSYQGAVASAMHYGHAMSLTVTLGRQKLYRTLGLRLPKNTEEEIDLGPRLTSILSGSRAHLEYVFNGDAIEEAMRASQSAPEGSVLPPDSYGA